MRIIVLAVTVLLLLGCTQQQAPIRKANAPSPWQLSATPEVCLLNAETAGGLKYGPMMVKIGETETRLFWSLFNRTWSSEDQSEVTAEAKIDDRPAFDVTGRYEGRRALFAFPEELWRQVTAGGMLWLRTSEDSYALSLAGLRGTAAKSFEDCALEIAGSDQSPL